MKSRNFLAALIVAASWSFSAWAAAPSSDPYSVPFPVAVENKLYVPLNELNLQLGLLPLDAFYKALLVNFGYTHYFESYWGWEVVNASAAFNFETNLRKDLRNDFGVTNANYLDYVRYMATTNLIYTPVYNKNLLFNTKVVHGEISGLAGGGVVSYKSKQTVPLVGGGLIYRFFASERWSYKLDNRVYYQFASNKSTDFILTINLGIAFELDPVSKKERRQE